MRSLRRVGLLALAGSLLLAGGLRMAAGYRFQREIIRGPFFMERESSTRSAGTRRYGSGNHDDGGGSG